MSQPLSSSEAAATRRLLIPGLFVAVTAVSFAAIFFRKASPTHPLVAAGLRLAFASVLLSPWLLSAWRRGTLTRTVLLHGSVAGLFYGVHFGAWVSSLTLTSVAASVTLVTATPSFSASRDSSRDATGPLGVTGSRSPVGRSVSPSFRSTTLPLVRTRCWATSSPCWGLQGWPVTC